MDLCPGPPCPLPAPGRALLSAPRDAPSLLLPSSEMPPPPPLPTTLLTCGATLSGLLPCSLPRTL